MIPAPSAYSGAHCQYRDRDGNKRGDSGGGGR